MKDYISRINSQSKSPIWNIFLGNFDFKNNNLNNLFISNNLCKDEIQLLKVCFADETKIIEDELCDEILIDKNSINWSVSDNDFIKLLSKTIDRFAKKAKQYTYDNLGCIQINIIICSKYNSYTYFDKIILSIDDVMNNIFPNDVKIDLFCIFEKSFDVYSPLYEANNELFVKLKNLCNETVFSLINSIYILSNYNNFEIYNENYMHDLLFDLSNYIYIKGISNHSNNENALFDDKSFVEKSNYYSNHRSINDKIHYNSIGNYVYQKPIELIKSIIKNQYFDFIKQNKYLTVDEFAKILNFEYIDISNIALSNMTFEIDGIERDLYQKEQSLKSHFNYLKSFYNLRAIQENVNEKMLSIIEVIKIALREQISSQLVYLLRANNYLIFQLSDLIDEFTSNYIQQITTEIKKNFSESAKDLREWEQSSPSGITKTLINLSKDEEQSAKNKSIDFFNIWKNKYKKKIKYKLEIEICTSVVAELKEFKSMINNSLDEFINVESDNIGNIQRIIRNSNSKFIVSLCSYYNDTIDDILKNNYAYLNDFGFVRKNENSFDDELKCNLESIFKTANNLTEEIYNIYLEKTSFFDDIVLGLPDKDSQSLFSEIFNDILQNNNICVRVQDKEEINKEIYIIVDKNSAFRNYVNSIISKSDNNLNVKLITTDNYRKDYVWVLYLNGNIHDYDLL